METFWLINWEAKISTLEAASQISLRGGALILSAVNRKPAPDFTELPGALETWNQLLSPITALPALDLANTERKPPHWGYTTLCRWTKREIANRWLSEVRNPRLSQELSHLWVVWVSTHKAFLGTAAYWETKAWGSVPVRTTSVDTVHKVKKRLLLKLLFHLVPTLFG